MSKQTNRCKCGAFRNPASHCGKCGDPAPGWRRLDVGDIVAADDCYWCGEEVGKRYPRQIIQDGEWIYRRLPALPMPPMAPTVPPQSTALPPPDAVFTTCCHCGKWDKIFRRADAAKGLGNLCIDCADLPEQIEDHRAKQEALCQDLERVCRERDKARAEVEQLQSRNESLVKALGRNEDNVAWQTDKKIEALEERDRVRAELNLVRQESEKEYQTMRDELTTLSRRLLEEREAHMALVLVTLRAAKQ
jgi:hypothetical protein